MNAIRPSWNRNSFFVFRNAFAHDGENYFDWKLFCCCLQAMSQPYDHVVQLFLDVWAGDYIADLLDWIDFADRVDNVNQFRQVRFQEVAVEIVIDNGTRENPIDLSHDDD